MTDSSDGEWERGWDGHEHAQLLRLSKLTLAQKIQWLDDAHRVVEAIEHSRAAVRGSRVSAKDVRA